ncbi:MAG: HAMP domain-containing sensor histidine kinase [Clostridiales bacterium]|nr:HAMP domain-containing sensor histidine kinase [Clostridiales bacterium]
MGRIKRTIHNLSVKKVFMLYMLLFLLLATLLSSITIRVADRIESNVNYKYLDSSEQYTLQNGRGKVSIVSPSNTDYTSQDRAIVTACSIVQIWSIPLYFGMCIIASALLFYRNKLKKPIELLSEASGKIAGDDLDFNLSYDSRDEMGRLCASFETMRAALLENNRELWRAIEERKRLNAAFSHDLRTPLTVLRGYTDFLKAYVPQGKISEQKLLSTVSTMSGQIDRLDRYVQTMGEVQRLEDIKASSEPVATASFMEQFQNSARVLIQESGRILDFHNEVSDCKVLLDLSIVQRVLENLLSNAAQYAKDIVSVRCRYEHEVLSITVEDDGPGFTAEDLKQAPKPYYRNKESSDGNHFGLGLTICKDLCEKHGGQLKLQNGEKGGACVTASFLCRETKS